MTRPRARLSEVLRQQILDANCAYCGGLWPTEVDHVIPHSRGGSDDITNLAPACGPCNASKLDFTPDEWRAWLESEGLPWPPKSREQLIRDLINEAIASGQVTEQGLAEAAAAMARPRASRP